jgi:hypothetical protein
MTSWPFADPPRITGRTLQDILEGRTELLRVVRTVVGEWQFMDAAQLSGRAAKYVSLEDMLEREPAIAELANLPLGWSAQRSSVSAPWQRAPLYPGSWQQLVDRATEHMKGLREQFDRAFDVGRLVHDYDPRTETLLWVAQDIPRFAARAPQLGVFSLPDQTWTWSRPSAPARERPRKHIEWLAAFGRDNGHERLAQPSFKGDSIDAWEAACVACLVLQAKNAIRLIHQGEYTLVMLEDMERLWSGQLWMGQAGGVGVQN